MAFGSCRTSVPHDEKGNRTHGVDALRAYALAMGGVTQPAGELPWPDLVLFLGDQVYADETSEEMQEFIESRRDIAEPPGKELKDYEEYAHLYRLAWSDPANRWLLSTLPSAMIFDDHDVRDDWNTSAQWRREMEATDVVARPHRRRRWRRTGSTSTSATSRPPSAPRTRSGGWSPPTTGADELDLTEALDAFAERVDQEPASYRWSFARDIAAPGWSSSTPAPPGCSRRTSARMLDDGEMAWLDEQMRGGVEHLFVGTSLPFLLPEGLQHLEAFSEALAGGRVGPARRAGRRAAAHRRSTSSTGVRSRTASTRSPRWRSRWSGDAGERRRGR